ncbi:MAG: hypothetical protein R3C13_08910 [Hyphomonas sp.]|uniref:hypothetical protein n=1 Tax=Hyphomonas sp. TaxID=87 RepID=UPI0035277E88
MTSGFSFDGALMNGFRAAHARTFPWAFAFAFATICTSLMVAFFFIARDPLIAFFEAAEALEGQPTPDDPMQVIGSLFGVLSPLIPWAIAGTLISWAVWAMFETASQRRYIRDEKFTLSFGGDELRMMGTGVFWFLMQAIIFFIPLAAGLSTLGLIGQLADGTMTENEVGQRALQTMGLVFASMLVLVPLYVFLATRYSPSFGLTLKDRKVAFFDGWIASRGRFWPILGAFVIVSVVAGIVDSIVSMIAQAAMMPAMLSTSFITDEIPDLDEFFTPAVFFAIVLYLFVRYFMAGLVMHFSAAPAAFAARHDPRGGVDDAQTISDFD